MQNETAKEAGVTLKFGTVSAIDEKGARVRVRLADFDNMRTGWLPVMHLKTLRDKHYHLPESGEHVVVLLDVNGEDGVILGAVYSAADTPPVCSVDKHHIQFGDGAKIEYDRAEHRLTIIGGVQEVLVETGATITLRAASKVTIDVPEAEFTGNLLVGGSLTYMQGMAGYGSIPGASAGAVLNGNVAIKGNARIDGNIDVGGDATVAGTNPNHHAH